MESKMQLTCDNCGKVFDEYRPETPQVFLCVNCYLAYEVFTKNRNRHLKRREKNRADE